MPAREKRWCHCGITLLAAIATAALTSAPASAHDEGRAPVGANDWSCTPTAAHPEPVLLVHGTWGNQNSWDTLAPELKAHEVCVFTLNYGHATASLRGAAPGVFGTADMRTSAKELAAFVDRVRTATGAAKVDVVAHSQGGPLVRQYLRFEGGAHREDPSRTSIRRLISIAATHHGTTAEGLRYLLPSGSAGAVADSLIARVLGTAAAQQLIDSEFLATLNAAGDTEPGVAYTAIASRVDRVVTPPEATFLRAGPRATVTNVWVQDVCPTDTHHHGILPDSPAVSYLVHRALGLPYRGTPCPAD
ncbi:alpha/beta fold hydrolase [Nocardia otitidiscaviarum]|uniref:Alpha/beta fold hydrolase n=1 Tax=Nocardia otitidiscaviarum TaxID=1823 RepID=A0A516NH97_9NOCA|nr:alpha/beta fold hydrolase [Nocardia otitidiscaviarum]MCP9623518.1 lipase family protein [Nocardia otitidiscaviarum]QDP78274.1 alpha/beta fold hydrolase [Nocardia otitidiscaviarum]